MAAAGKTLTATAAGKTLAATAAMAAAKKWASVAEEAAAEARKWVPVAEKAAAEAERWASVAVEAAASEAEDRASVWANADAELEKCASVCANASAEVDKCVAVAANAAAQADKWASVAISAAAELRSLEAVSKGNADMKKGLKGEETEEELVITNPKLASLIYHCFNIAFVLQVAFFIAHFFIYHNVTKDWWQALLAVAIVSPLLIAPICCTPLLRDVFVQAYAMGPSNTRSSDLSAKLLYSEEV